LFEFRIGLEYHIIEYFTEVYIIDHVNKVYSKDGRFENEVFPFFDTYLQFIKSQNDGLLNPVLTCKKGITIQ